MKNERKSLDMKLSGPHYGINESQNVPEERDIILYCNNSCYVEFVLSWGKNASTRFPADATSTERELENNRNTRLYAVDS